MDYVTLLGIAAATLTTGAMLPQLIKTLKTRHTADLSLGMFATLVAGVALWLVYGLLIGDVPIIYANTISLILASSILGMKIKYK